MQDDYDHREELQICHAFLNVLNSGYQGKYRMLSFLQHFGQSEEHQWDIETVQDLLEQIDEWMQRMWSGDNFGFLKSVGDPAEEVLQIIDFADELKQEIHFRADRADEILSADPQSLDMPALQELTSLIAYQAYAREQYILGIVAYGEIFGHELLAEKWKSELVSCEVQIERAFTFLETLKAARSISSSLRFEIREHALLLPAIFRCQAHDLNQIFALFHGEFSYALAEFSIKEAGEWESHGFSPREAGYWRAHEFEPDDVHEWLELGFESPILAGSWHYRGFSASEAREWKNAGYTAMQAEFYRSSGCDSPEKAASIHEWGH